MNLYSMVFFFPYFLPKKLFKKLPYPLEVGGGAVGVRGGNTNSIIYPSILVDINGCVGYLKKVLSPI